MNKVISLCLGALIFGSALQAMQSAERLGEELISAAEEGNLRRVEELLDMGAPINHPSKSFKDTPLMVAAGAGHQEIVKLLLAKGADVNQGDIWGDTSLIESTRYCYQEDMVARLRIIDLLIKNGAHANHQNIYGNSALVFAKTYAIGSLLLDAMLMAPIAQAELDKVPLTPEQMNRVIAAIGSLKRTSTKGLQPDTKGLIVRNLVNTLKRKNMIKEQINKIQELERREYFLRHLNENIEG